jgi:hypothetical protein
MTLSVYRANHVHGNVRMCSCLGLELAGVNRASKNGDASVWMKVGYHSLDVGIIADCVQPPQTRLIPKSFEPRPSENNIHGTSPTGTTPDTTWY